MVILKYTCWLTNVGRLAIIIILLYGIKTLHPNILPRVHASSTSSRSITGNSNPRLPRTSASQLNSTPINLKLTTKSLNATRNGHLRTREQHLLSIFEIIVSTLEEKLKRIDNVDENMDIMIHRIEGLETLLTKNIAKTDFITSQLLNLESIMSYKKHTVEESKSNIVNIANNSPQHFLNTTIKEKIENLDEKVTNIDNKLEVLKSQLDNNYLQIEDINGEASEKNPVTMNGIDILTSLSSEKMAHVSSELSDLRDTTDRIDRKLQFHINIVSENIATIMRMMNDIYISVVDGINIHNVTNPPAESNKSHKILDLLKKKDPLVTVPAKIDWDVMVDSKSSDDDFLLTSGARFSQTQRQERAIGEIHQDLKTKANIIVNNLDMVEKHLQEQESDAQPQKKPPVSQELSLDTVLDHLVEYRLTNYSVKDENLMETNSKHSTPAHNTFYSNVNNTEETHANTTTYSLPISSKPNIRKGGIIFPSIKNKPAIINSTLNNETLTLKDIRGFSCVDLMNAGMRQSGVFYLQIRGTTYWFLKVYCEQETSEGGWTVIQRRNDFGEPRENFNRDWADYKNGFGEPAKEFWLGNENIYMLTNNEDYTLRIELEDFDGNKKYAQYSHFKIHSEADYYKLEIDGYEGNAGDSLNDPWYGSNNSPFSTYNKDNDRSSLNCASMLKNSASKASSPEPLTTTISRHTRSNRRIEPLLQGKC
ncbi:uncharacterized protein LOC26515246 isoform X2 [Drosophila ananassae]|uniref:uncharacterized protein LOC26515246 isoform X2 n=1 Tax=Drosophila ananassae TaxID=7217 RepID=UPI001CFF7102|nr:uncharacterized protein LOC26515246 isoform X2 [Drosophila ananassae]